MFKRLLTTAFVATIFLSSGLANTVSAQDTNIQAGENIGICTFIKPICDAFGLSGEISVQSAFDYLRDRANILLSVLFVGIILLSVFIIVQAGIKYIQSQGDEKQIGEAQKAIKTVFIGIGVLFVGIAGLVLVLAFFGGLGLLNSGTSVNDIICPESQNGAAGDCVVQ
jgi:hypothetical protein